MRGKTKKRAGNCIAGLARSVVLGSLFSCRLFFPSAGEGATLAGQEVRGGGSVDIRFPVAQYFQDYAAQGGNPQQIEQPHLLPGAPVRLMLTAPRTGYIAGIQSEQMGHASMLLGAGRFKKGEQIDHRTGLILQAKVGDHRQAREPLIEIHARSVAEADSIQELLLQCYTWSDTPVTVGPLIYDTIRP